MREEKTSLERLLSIMPDGWEAKAKELDALVRGREIKNTLDLLRLVFLCLTEGKSFSGTAVLLELAGICSISKRAVFKNAGNGLGGCANTYTGTTRRITGCITQ
jgi:hypothetical protein